MNKNTKIFFIACTLNLICFFAVEGASSWFKWGERQIENNAEAWKAALDNQQYGKLFSSLNTCIESGNSAMYDSAIAWIAEASEGSFDPFIRYMHARNYFGSRSKDSEITKY